MVQKEHIQKTPTRMKTQYAADIDEKIILTPTQFKDLLHYLRKE